MALVSLTPVSRRYLSFCSAALLTPGWLSRESSFARLPRTPVACITIHPPLPTRRDQHAHSETLRHLARSLPEHLPHELLLSTAACLSPVCRVPLSRLTRASRTNSPRSTAAPHHHHPDAASRQAVRRPTVASCADPPAAPQRYVARTRLDMTSKP